MKMSLSQELKWRGFVQESTLNDLSQLDKKKLVFYHGFDASASSQTVGNLAAMMADRLFLRHGHDAIILAGGATSLIGDPGGKDKERPLQDEKTIAANIAQAEKQIKNVFAGYKYKLVNNLDWLKDVKLIDFLRDTGKHYSMTPLVQRDYIAKRIGEGGTGLSYTEFSYTILQGFDYLHLFDSYGCNLQIGGSDQWGNCLSGVELVRKARGKEVDAITLPLIVNKATGNKFGKTEDGAIWLDPELTSVYQFYQFWLNTDDEDVGGYLKIFTELDKPEIDKVIDDFNDDKSKRSAQKILAAEVTKIVHGKDAADSAKKVTEILFSSHDYSSLESSDFNLLSIELPSATAGVGDTIASATVETGLASSNSEARRLLSHGAIYLNNQQISEDYKLKQSDGVASGHAILRRGKNANALIKLR